MTSRIHNPKKMRQLIDFQGCSVGNGMYPTDIDALIEYKDSEYILFEVKYNGAVVPLGQKLAIQRMIDDFTKVGKQAVAFICDHDVKDAKNPIILAKCKVRTIYYGKEKMWRAPDREITVKEAVDSFREFSDLIIHKKESSDES